MQCLECGLSYCEKSSEDRLTHRAYHDRMVNGVPAPPLMGKVVWQNGKDRIIVVTSASPEHLRHFAAEVGRAANKEMHYDFGVYDEHEPPDDRDLHLFLYCSGDRAVGLSMLEKRTQVSHYTWEEADKRINKPFVEQEAIWSLVFAWVHKKYRCRGIATINLMKAARYLGVQIREIGLYTPFSSDGEAFARSIFPDDFLIAK